MTNYGSKKSWLVVMIAAALLSLTVGGLTAAANGSDKTITVGMWSAPGNMSPINADSSYGYFLVRFLFDTLVEMQTDLTFEPRLAESWDVSEDGRTYTFHLHPDATWHDGTPLTAEDVEFTLKTIATPGVQTNRGSGLMAVEGLDANGKLPEVGADISGVEVVDAHTIKVTTKTAVDPARFFEQFGTGVFIIPKHLLAGLSPEELARTDVLLRPTVGSGPFRFVRYVTDQFVELERYDDYYRGPAKVGSIIVKIVEATSIVAQLINGEIDVVAGPGIGEVPLQDWELIQRASNVRPVTEPGLNYQFMSFNLQRPYLQDKRVRQAFALAINQQLIVDQLLQGQGVVARGPFSPITPYENTDIDPIPYDPARARELLQDAGWNFGQSVELLVPTGNVVREQTASIIQANLQAIGVRVQIRRADFASALGEVFGGGYDMVVLGWQDTFDPAHVNSVYQTGGQYNMSNFSNAEADALMQAAGDARDPQERKRLYDQLQVLLQDEVPVVFLYYQNMLAAANRCLVDADPAMTYFEVRSARWDVVEGCR